MRSGRAGWMANCFDNYCDQMVGHSQWGMRRRLDARRTGEPICSRTVLSDRICQSRFPHGDPSRTDAELTSAEPTNWKISVPPAPREQPTKRPRSSGHVHYSETLDKLIVNLTTRIVGKLSPSVFGSPHFQSDILEFSCTRRPRQD